MSSHNEQESVTEEEESLSIPKGIILAQVGKRGFEEDSDTRAAPAKRRK